MGCTQSKIENEETVTRCKERKQYMKEAVVARNAFAAAHSAYAMSLKNTGAALSDYAQGEVQYPSAAAAAAAAVVPSSSAALLQPGYDSFIAPPPPLPPQYTTSPLQRANTAPEISFPKSDLKPSDTIMEEDENEGEGDSESVHGLKHRNSKSSGGGGGAGGSAGGIYRQGPVEDEILQRPPSPPRTPPQNNRATPPPPPPPGSAGMAYWDFFTDDVLRPTLADVDENRIVREEMERKMIEEERAKRSEADGGGGGRKSMGKAEVESDEVVDKEAKLPPQPPQPSATTKVVKKVKQVVPAEGKRKSVANMNLVQIFADLDDCFLKASESAHEVSKMLEANRLHYHSNFADNRGIFLSEYSV